MEHETEDNRCTNWNHVWMQGCQTCVENRTRQQALLDAVDAVKTQYRSRDNRTYDRDEDWDNGVDAAISAIEQLSTTTDTPAQQTPPTSTHRSMPATTHPTTTRGWHTFPPRPTPEA